MNAMSEQTRQAAALSLTELLYPGMVPTGRAGVDYCGLPIGGLGAPIGETPDRDGALWRLLRAMGTRWATLRERRATFDNLASMSDHHLADIGLSRAQVHHMFNPAFASAPNNFPLGR